jgi:signal transduction histidine kinase
MMIYYGNLEGLSFGLTYIVGCLLIAILGMVTLRSDQARNESQALLAELQVANQKLRDYAKQIETLAAAEERNRLARELHDSVSQTIFSMNLTAQSARILIDRDPERVAGLLDHLQTLSQNALGEMRSLIQQLRPHSLIENGLPAALRDHAAERFEQDNLKVEVQVKGKGHLPPIVEEGLFRIAQEALNNIVKHAKTDKAMIQLKFVNDLASLTIEDQGVGFDQTSTKSATGHMGLSSMRERVESLGGNLDIDTSPGKGTRIRIEIRTTKDTKRDALHDLDNQETGKETENV